MKAAWYEKQGAARDVLVVGNMDDPQPQSPSLEMPLRIDRPAEEFGHYEPCEAEALAT